LDIQVAPHRGSTSVITLALERVFLEAKDPPLHPILGNFDYEQSVAQPFPLAAPLPVFQVDDVVETMAANIGAFGFGVLVTTLTANVYEDLRDQPLYVLCEQSLPHLCI
jgi:hypothetical protein